MWQRYCYENLPERPACRYENETLFQQEIDRCASSAAGYPRKDRKKDLNENDRNRHEKNLAFRYHQDFHKNLAYRPNGRDRCNQRD